MNPFQNHFKFKQFFSFLFFTFWSILQFVNHFTERIARNNLHHSSLPFVDSFYLVLIKSKISMHKSYSSGNGTKSNWNSFLYNVGYYPLSVIHHQLKAMHRKTFRFVWFYSNFFFVCSVFVNIVQTGANIDYIRRFSGL